MHQFRREDLVQILTEPKNALVKQYQRFFGYDTIELVFTEDALWEIGDQALERETGARGLRSIIEARAARRDVRAPVAQGRLQVRDHEGDDLEGSQADARHERRARDRRWTRSSKKPGSSWRNAWFPVEPLLRAATAAAVRAPHRPANPAPASTLAHGDPPRPQRGFRRGRVPPARCVDATEIRFGLSADDVAGRASTGPSAAGMTQVPRRLRRRGTALPS